MMSHQDLRINGCGVEVLSSSLVSYAIELKALYAGWKSGQHTNIRGKEASKMLVLVITDQLFLELA
eukprot:748649-Hanusia_phi.AAC.3